MINALIFYKWKYLEKIYSIDPNSCVCWHPRPQSVISNAINVFTMCVHWFLHWTSCENYSIHRYSCKTTFFKNGKFKQWKKFYISPLIRINRSHFIIHANVLNVEPNAFSEWCDAFHIQYMYWRCRWRKTEQIAVHTTHRQVYNVSKSKIHWIIM